MHNWPPIKFLDNKVANFDGVKIEDVGELGTGAHEELSPSEGLCMPIKSVNCETRGPDIGISMDNVDLQDAPSHDAKRQSARLLFELATSQAELTELREEHARLRFETDRTTARLHGQLAEATADAKALRARLSKVTGEIGVKCYSATMSLLPGPLGVGGFDEADSIKKVDCFNCRRMQKLIDVLQVRCSPHT
ncbi:unnamed protein product [Protopolystoma xenopodis]|uniref:Uncharacterized protein n=1 Tax=Protopolystoma xenopodis TaxID=117903 RepID=A0A3S5C1X9_9PLAT|nr:unnamed protein product [Protopolystoma xenopodis]